MIALIKKFLEKKIQSFIGKENIKQVENFITPSKETSTKKKRSNSSKKSS